MSVPPVAAQPTLDRYRAVRLGVGLSSNPFAHSCISVPHRSRCGVLTSGGRACDERCDNDRERIHSNQPPSRRFLRSETMTLPRDRKSGYRPLSVHRKAKRALRCSSTMFTGVIRLPCGTIVAQPAESIAWPAVGRVASHEK